MSAHPTTRTTWAVALEGQVASYGKDARYPGFDTYTKAIQAAFDHARAGYTATLLRVDGPDHELVFTPLAIVTPPAAPKEDS